MNATRGRKELWLGLYGGLVVNLAVAAVCNNNPWGAAPSTTQWLMTLAMFNELYGVLLIASPELIPLWQRARTYLGARTGSLARAVGRGIRRLLRLPEDATVYAKAGAATAGTVVGGDWG